MSKLDDVLKNLEHNTITFTIPMISDPKQNIVFRPLKTKDQKILVIDKEEIDSKEIKNFDAIIKLLDAVVVKCPVPLGSLEITDFIWLLLNIRAKSLGETIELIATCKTEGCEQKNDLNIDIYKDYKIDKNPIDNIVKINKDIILTLGNITIEDFREILEYIPEDRAVASLASAIKSVEFENEVIDADLSAKLAIASEFTKEINDKIGKFVENRNKGIRLEKTCKCKKCGKDSTYSFDSLEIINFF